MKPPHSLMKLHLMILYIMIFLFHKAFFLFHKISILSHVYTLPSLLPSIDFDSTFTIISSSHKHNIQLWHVHMNYTNIPIIQKMNKRQSLLDFKLLNTKTLTHLCLGCIMEKQHKLIYLHDPTIQYFTILGEFIHKDILNKQHQILFFKGSICYIFYKDDITTYSFVYFTK